MGRDREKPAERGREKCSGKFVWCCIPVAQLRKIQTFKWRNSEQEAVSDK